MKIFKSIRFLLLSILLALCNCSDNNDVFTIDDITLDEQTFEKWNGEEIPSWLGKRFKEFIIHEKIDWALESYLGPMICMIYSFDYESNKLIAVDYTKFGHSIKSNNFYYESGTVCYTDDGRRVDFRKVKNAFNKNKKLIYSNAWDGDNIPQLTDFKLPIIESANWLQNRINQICDEIVEPKQLLYHIICGTDTEAKYIALIYKYFDMNKIKDGPIMVKEFYTLDGEPIQYNENIIFEIDQLCTLLQIESHLAS